MNPLYCEKLLSLLSNCQGLLQDEPADPTPLALYLRVLKNIGEPITSKFFKAKNFNLPSPCPLPAPSHSCFGINLLGEGGSFAGAVQKG